MTTFAADHDWSVEALCAQVDPDRWFPAKGESPRAVKQICRACPVQAQCLAFALANGEREGIWGGTSFRERRQMPGWTPHSEPPKGRCRNGHLIAEVGVYRRPGDGLELCLECRRSSKRRYDAKRRTA